MALKQDGAHFILFPEQRNKIESVVLNRVHIFRTFCTKHGRGFLGVSNPQRLIYTQILVKYPPPLPRGFVGKERETNR